MLLSEKCPQYQIYSPDAGQDISLLLVQLLDVFLPKGLELFHAEVLRLPHHGIRAGVLVPLGELGCQIEVILIKRSARVFKYSCLK